MEPADLHTTPLPSHDGTATVMAIEPVVTQPVTEAPVERGERITALDTLRGFALLGILLMNIVGFALYFSAYDNPTVAGGGTGANLAIWAVLHVLAEGKMRCLFSLVFGASMILLTSRLERSGYSAADIWYRRTIWLLLFGIVHAYLLWVGDILYPYALCALVLYPFRAMRPKSLFILGGIFVALTSAAYVGSSFDTKEKVEKGRAAVAAEKSGRKLTEEQQDAKSEYEKWLKFNKPTQEQIDKEAKGWRGNALEVIKTRAKYVGFFHGNPYYSPFAWDIWSMMFIGMALFKNGVLSAQRPSGLYWKMMLAGYGIGIPLNAWTAWYIIQTNFDPVQQSLLASTYDIGRLTVAFGHLGAILLMCRSGAWTWLTSRLGAVGQMAFSNYIMHSIICSFLFTGYGLALYGKLQRYEIYYVVAAIWLFQLVVSPIWLRHFRFGPLEWVWRSLTYWKKQPMRLAA